MNIFLPYEYNIVKSVQALDDKRLNKQILECYQLLKNAIKESNGETIKGYKYHPIYVHYKQFKPFLITYGIQCCREFNHRFKVEHSLKNEFINAFFEYDGGAGLLYYKPFYMEGSKGQPNYIRTLKNVSELYQNKLINKWLNDKKAPKWTNRKMPKFYIDYLEIHKDEKVVNNG